MKHDAGVFRHCRAAADQFVNFRRRRLTPFRKRADFRRNDGKAFALFFRAGGLDSRVQREHPRLADDVFNHGNFFGDFFHLADSFHDGLSRFFRNLRGGLRNLRDGFGILRILADCPDHFLHGTGCFLRH